MRPCRLRQSVPGTFHSREGFSGQDICWRPKCFITIGLGMNSSNAPSGLESAKYVQTDIDHAETDPASPDSGAKTRSSPTSFFVFFGLLHSIQYGTGVKGRLL
jgi:hypothetical protein